MTSEETTETTTGHLFRRLPRSRPPARGKPTVAPSGELPTRSGRRTTGFDGTYRVLGETQLLSPEEEAELERQIAALEEDPAVPVSTALRWRKPQLDLVRRAARLAGVPYQAYLKQAAIRSAIDDLRAAREAGVDFAE